MNPVAMSIPDKVISSEHNNVYQLKQLTLSGLIFAWINLRGLVSFAKICPREKSQNRPFAKINPREMLFLILKI